MSGKDVVGFFPGNYVERLSDGSTAPPKNISNDSTSVRIAVALYSYDAEEEGGGEFFLSLSFPFFPSSFVSALGSISHCLFLV